jgi:CRP/FNR family cyclic AMP-dependent transcriptional regulator
MDIAAWKRYMSGRLADLLDGLELFSDFSYPELVTIGTYLTRLACKKGEAIFNEGDAGGYMLILVEGRMAISKQNEGAAQLLCRENKGRTIGEMALLDNECRSATCVADTDCELLTLSHERLARLALDHPILAYRFMFQLAKLLSRRLRRTSGVLAEYLAN